jgi:hypothetical protein
MDGKRSIKKDIILLCALAAAGLIIAGAVLLFSQGGSTVAVRVNGSITAQYPLSSSTRTELEGEGGGHNLLVIENGEAWIESADCPDGLCIRTGRISRTGQSIVCLPHKLVVEIQGGEVSQTDIDVYVK